MPDDARRDRRVSVPGAPGLRLPAPDEVPRNVQRQHPSHESTDPPPSESTITQWPPDPIPPPRGYRVPRVDTGPPPSSYRDGIRFSVSQKVALAALAIVSTVLTLIGAYLKITEKPPAPTEAVVEVDHSSRSRDNTHRVYLKGQFADQAIKDTAVLAYLCWLNKDVSPFANVKCPELKCVQQPVTRDGKIVPKQFVCVFDVEWPNVRLPP